MVKKSDVNLRSAPSSVNTSVLAVLQSGTQLEVISTSLDSKDPAYSWCYVKYKGMLGYMINRSINLRRLRLPAPRVKPGDEI